jgi:two-component system response regulator MprA
MSGYVLVVDDEVCIRELLRAFLEEEGYAVETAANGAEALDRVAVQPPALVLSDINMPVMSGPELCRALQARWLAAPVVLMSAGLCDDTVAGLNGAAGFLAKPFDLDELVSTVERLVPYYAGLAVVA